MIRFVVAFSLLFFAAAGARAQDIPYGIRGADVAAVDRAEIAAFAERTLAKLDGDGSEPALSSRYFVQVAAGRYPDAAASAHALRDLYRARKDAGADHQTRPFEVYAQARAAEAGGQAFEAAYAGAFAGEVARLDDLAARRAVYWFWAPVGRMKAGADAALKARAGAATLPLADAVGLLRAWTFWDIYRTVTPASEPLVAADEARRYVIETDVLIKTPAGVTLSAAIVRPRTDKPLPTVMQFTIYTNPGRAMDDARTAAAHGYAGIVVDARGKRLSPDEIRPNETEVEDADAAIDWISRQGWSDKRVGFYGGSYNAFAAWAAAKRMHPALKTIVSRAAAIPGQGLPMENNVFITANYAWPFYVANNRLLDTQTYNDPRWAALDDKWYASGRPFREIDQVDGTPNPWLQRWLKHPAYDEYWQSMVAYGKDFARIDIPVLSLTGYYDDGQISAVQYLKDHYRYRPDAEHYLVIGPYDHVGSLQDPKAMELRGYRLDPSAQFSTEDLVYDWMDHVLRGAPRPAILADKINYQVMGADRWGHAPSLAAMAKTPLVLHLTDAPEAGHYRLSERPAKAGAIKQVVDFADRTTTSASYYPNPIVGKTLDLSKGLVFMSAPMATAVEFSGGFSGALEATINKRDFDFQLTLYELRRDGSAMQLTYVIGRASYARDMTRRKLLTPGKRTVIPFERTRLVSRRIEAGSRIVAVLDVIKNGGHQINYGTGRDVSDESIADAKEPLVVSWGSGSFIRLPMSPVAEAAPQP